MKKFIILIAMMILPLCGFSYGVNTLDTNANIIKVFDESKRNYDFSTAEKSVIRMLDVDSRDSLELRRIYRGFCDGMIIASKEPTQEKADLMAVRSIGYLVYNYNYMLPYDKYRKFLRILNVTLQNRGFASVVVKYGDSDI